MRSMVLFAVLLVVAGVYLFGGRRLDKEQVLDFYRVMEMAQLAGDDVRMCDLPGDDFEQRTEVRGRRIEMPARMDKGDCCIALAQQASLQRRLGVSMRGGISSQFWLDGVTLSDDRRSAVMHMRSLHALPGMQTTTRADLQVECRRWRIQVIRSQAVVSVGG